MAIIMVIKMILALLCTAVISYFLGSCNSAIITVKLWKHEDIREKGSKNAGLTNTLRCYGKGPALVTLIGDLSKGIISVLLSILVFRLFFGDTIDSRFVGYIAGFFAIIPYLLRL
jgi:glycerol-3-phosphate acyltransferase PlsY